jgi:hypothetical protein
LPSAKHEIKSVPPAIDASCRSALMLRYTKSKLDGASGEPVERMERSAGSACSLRGSKPDFSSALRYFALVPNTLMRSRSARRHKIPGSGCSGAPS